jgi:hypothetical protein
MPGFLQLRGIKEQAGDEAALRWVKATKMRIHATRGWVPYSSQDFALQRHFVTASTHGEMQLARRSRLVAAVSSNASTRIDMSQCSEGRLSNNETLLPANLDCRELSRNW